MIFKEYHAPKFLGAGFLLIVLIGGYLAYGRKQGNLELRAQEIQAIKECEERYRKEFEGTEVTFQGVTSERFGDSQIIVRGTVSFASTTGQIGTEKMHCNINTLKTPS